MPQILYNKSFTLADAPLSVDSLLTDLIDKGELYKCRLVVPTGKLHRYYRNRLIRLHYDRTGKPLNKFEVSNLKEFVTWAYAKLFPDQPVRVVSDAYRLAVFEDAASIANLEFFVKKGNTISSAVLKRLADIIYGLKEDGITPDDLFVDIAAAGANPDLGYNVRKLSDIANLFAAYQSMMTDSQLDYPELLNKLNKLIDDNQETTFNLFNNSYINRLLPDDSFILLTGFTQFSKPEIAFLSQFANSSLPIAILLDYDTDNGPFLFGNIEDTINDLTSSGFLIKENSQLDPNEDCMSVPSLYLRRWLFNNEKDIRNEAIDDCINIYACDDREDEVRTVASQIIDITRDNANNLKDICILVQQPDLYSNLFRQIFRLYGIPVNVTDRYPLANSPVTVSIFSLIDIAVEGCRREDVHKAMLNQYIRWSDTPIDGENLYDISARNRIQGGKRRGGIRYWFRKFDQIIAILKMRVAICQNESDIDKNELLAVSRELESTEKAYSDFKLLISKIPDTRKDYTPSQFSSMIRRDIIGKLGIRDNITAFYLRVIEDKRLSRLDKTGIAEKIEKDARALKAFVRVLDEMCFILSDRYPGKSFPLEELTHRLKLTVSAEKYQVLEREGYGVTVTSIEQTRGIPYRTMFLVGAVDREFPSAYRAESFLGKELPTTEKKHLHARRLEFFQFLTNAPDLLDSKQKRIVITYPKSIDGNESVRSPFIDSLLKITYLEQNNRIFNISQLRNLHRLGEDAIADADNAATMQANELQWLRYASTLEELSDTIGKSIRRAKPDTEGLDTLRQIATRENFTDVFNHVCRINSARFEASISLCSTDLNDRAMAFLSDAPERVYSVTELDEYVSCPYKYFLHRAMNLKETIYPESGLSPLERGSLLHRILYLFYSQLQKRVIDEGGYAFLNANRTYAMPEIAPVGLDYYTDEENESILLEIARKEIDGFAIDHPFFELEKVEILGDSTRPGILREWYRAERKRNEKWGGFLPALFEFEFGAIGSNKRDKSKKYIELDSGLRLKGKIDRIEIDGMGGNKMTFLVCDYKSSVSAASTASDVHKGHSFQLPLYSAAMKKVFQEDYKLEADTGGGLYYLLKPTFDDKSNVKGHIPAFVRYDLKMVGMSKVKNIEEEIEAIENKAMAAIRNIQSGVFPVEPLNDKSCRYCGFNAICRISEKKKTAVISSAKDGVE